MQVQILPAAHCSVGYAEIAAVCVFCTDRRPEMHLLNATVGDFSDKSLRMGVIVACKNVVAFVAQAPRCVSVMSQNM